MVEGWRSVEELIGWGFAYAPVVIANEAHSGLARCIRTRDVGVRMIRAAHKAGVRRLAMEALPWTAIPFTGLNRGGLSHRRPMAFGVRSRLREAPSLILRTEARLAG